MRRSPFPVIYVLASLIAIAGLARAEDVDALSDVNAARAARGLRPYIRDANLTAGALNVAKFRADRRITGHSANDFAGLPPGTSAPAAGCGVEHPGFGWLSCCTYENWTYAGAAKSRGPDGRLYYQLFVNGLNVSQSQGVSNASSRFYPVSSYRGRRR